ncbi:hypothetical protein Dthio_PD2139 [Desulfonatronospira thiodismutans ASO3-1]|uniref:Uncharacterized protein n=1 Tax=Desulfonatronospira thiodismutans ASO3-1 TaxID=555779 RepID=D6SPT7_9BACT|nr:hypothetical protein [Desulfonatronospira thiodismutans]EFI34763.1 hypothetical protein Dthio_PD2139 [Desulfonatronospira thiodismutans ASO3-1]
MYHEQMYHIGEYILSHKGLQNYFKQEGANAKSFWRQFRSDMMRQRPETIKKYLCSEDSRLNHHEYADKFGKELYEMFFSEDNDQEQVRMYINAVIYFCLEMDASFKVQDITDKNKKQSLKTALHIWEAK